ncbi:MAG TPA: alpha/beta hydrolase [Bacteriovoracaceae bacterium]|nr:alpha/beta hydrolase [Bacteriovoracaceae bacterium]
MIRINSPDSRLSFIDNQSDSENVIVFIHGNSHNCTTFRSQFEDPALAEYRLVALDLPGHGVSDALPGYQLKDLTDALKTLVDSLELRKYILVGHSLGGHVVLESLSTLAPQGILIFGTPPLSRPLDLSAFRPHPSMALVGKNQLEAPEIQALLASFYHKRTVGPADVAEFNGTDLGFRESISKSFGRGEFQDEVDLLNAYQGHKAVIYGSHDPMINPEYLKQKIDLSSLWKKGIVELASSHNLHVEDPLLFNQELANFADLVFSGAINSTSNFRREVSHEGP